MDVDEVMQEFAEIKMEPMEVDWEGPCPMDVDEVMQEFAEIKMDPAQKAPEPVGSQSFYLGFRVTISAPILTFHSL